MPSILVLYGSETGMSEEVAQKFSYKMHHYGIQHILAPFDGITLPKFQKLYTANSTQKLEHIVVISSTAGQGELPTPIRNSELWKFLKRKDLPTSFFGDINFYFLGIGDSLYAKFQHAIRLLKLRFIDKLGGNLKLKMEMDVSGMKGNGSVDDVFPEFLKLARGFLADGNDDVYVSDSVFIPMGPVLRIVGESVSGNSAKNVLDDAEFDVGDGNSSGPVDSDKISSVAVNHNDINSVAANSDSVNSIATNSVAANSDVINSTDVNAVGANSAAAHYNDINAEDTTIHDTHSGNVLLNERITAHDHFQDVRRVVITNTTNFKPGDSLSLMPVNTDAAVDEFLKLQPHLKPYLLKPVSVGCSGEIVTLQELLKTRLDITSVPRRFFFMKVWNFQETSNESEIATLEQHKQKLYEFGHADDDYDYLEYVYRPRRSILEILYDFQYVKLPFEHLLDIIPTIRPRQYSISNTFDSDGGNVEITVAVLEYKTLLFKKRLGLCSNYIKNLTVGQEVSFQINHLHLFDKIERFIMEGVEDILLVSPGVGVAPVKSFVLENDYMDFNKTMYFGSRFLSKDNLYGDLFAQLSGCEEYNLTYRHCHSRDPDNVIDGTRIKYVQDLLWKDAEYVHDMIINKNCIIYLCGSAGQMPTQVKMTFIAILEKYGVENASSFVENLIKEDRFIQETW